MGKIMLSLNNAKITSVFPRMVVMISWVQTGPNLVLYIAFLPLGFLGAIEKKINKTRKKQKAFFFFKFLL